MMMLSVDVIREIRSRMINNRNKNKRKIENRVK